MEWGFDTPFPLEGVPKAKSCYAARVVGIRSTRWELFEKNVPLSSPGHWSAAAGLKRITKCIMVQPANTIPSNIYATHRDMHERGKGLQHAQYFHLPALRIIETAMRKIDE